MEISEEHIREAEQILIGGNKFDKERIDFIRNLSTIDLLAVPGSGKTTALLAKLYCLSKHLPLNDGSGILVLSHTNAAIDEIEKNLHPFCPKLFEYPNFVGTVQGFVDKFLAIPYYTFHNKTKIHRIDDVLYAKEIEFSLSKQRNGEIAYYKNRNPNLFYNARFQLNYEGKPEIIDGTTREFIKFSTPSKWDKEGTKQEKIDNIKSFIKNTKIELLKQGVLCYDDCYFLADNYLYKYSKITNYLQKRFQYVFIDETQDLETYQIDIIDKIFYDEKSNTIIQRIGDINQAIYNSGKKVKVEADWKPRNEKYLNGSNRLTPEIAKIVNFFILAKQPNTDGNPKFVVNGLRHLDNTIKPYVILFDLHTKEQLKNKFKELIQRHNLQDTAEGKKYGFKIIGWNAKWDDDEQHDSKLRLEDMFDSYKKRIDGKKSPFDSISKYLQGFTKEKKTLKIAREAIINALTYILRIENKTYITVVRGKEVERYFTKQEIINTIQNRENSSDYEYFKEKLYEWTYGLMVQEDYSGVYESLKSFVLHEFKDWFGLSIIQEVKDFLGTGFEKIVANNLDKEDININQQEGINIEIGTVHSAKGQTHCATMYIETSFHGYETNKLKIKKTTSKTKPTVMLPNPLFGVEHNYRTEKDAYAKQALKMMYVGFSRPTHLLCFAVLKENVRDDIQKLEDAGWEIEDIT